jgi:hypothetical protein
MKKLLLQLHLFLLLLGTHQGVYLPVRSGCQGTVTAWLSHKFVVVLHILKKWKLSSSCGQENQSTTGNDGVKLLEMKVLQFNCVIVTTCEYYNTAG